MKKILSVVLALVLVLSVMSASAITLKKGSKGTLVKRVQVFLNDGGFGSLKVDGVYGTGTVAAVKRYQKWAGLKQDGLTGARTLKAMGINTDNDPEGEPDDDDDDNLRICQYGSTGAKVKDIQKRLKNLGYPVGSADGTFGAKTRSAVRSFQSLNNIKVDGKVGPLTYSVLTSGNAAPYKASGSSAVTYTTLRKGSSGSLVKKLQKALVNQNYLSEDHVTSYYDDETRQAVRSFQADSGLTVDGVAGSETQAALYGTDYDA